MMNLSVQTKHRASVLLGFIFITLLFLAQYLSIFTSKGYIWYNDAAFYYNALSDPRSVFTTANYQYFFTSQGNSLFLYGLPSLFIYGINSIIQNPEITSKLLTFGIFYLTLIHLWYRTLAFTKKPIIAVAVSAIFLSLNSTIEYINFGGFYYHFFSLNGLIILIFELVQSKDRHYLSWGNSAMLILSALLLNHPFYIILYLIIYTVFIFNSLKYKTQNYYIIKIILPILFLLIANMYWLIPFIISIINPSLNTAYSQNGKFVFEGFKTAANIFNVLRFGQYYNSSSASIAGNDTNTYILPSLLLFTIVASFFNKHVFKYKVLIFLSTVSIFLAASAQLPLFNKLVEYAFHNISFFALFRSITRFAIIYLICSLVLLGVYLKHQKNYKLLSTITIVLTIFSSTFLFRNNFLEGTINLTNPPKEYYTINKLTKSNKDLNILVYPTTTYDSFTWSNNENKKAMQQIFLFYDYMLENPIITERTSLSLQYNSLFDKKILSDDLIKKNAVLEYNSIIEETYIGYILIDKNKLDIFTGLPIEYKKYTEFLGNNSLFTKLEDNDQYALYQRNISLLKLPTQTIDNSILPIPRHPNNPFLQYYYNDTNLNNCILINKDLIGERFAWDQNCIREKIDTKKNKEISLNIKKPYDEISWIFLLFTASLLLISPLFIFLVRERKSKAS